MSEKKIVICADDYAYSTQASKAIRELLLKNKINATSCMTDTKFWIKEAKNLKKEINKTKNNNLIGLHFTLTEQVNSKHFIRSCFKNKNISLLELLIRSKLRLVSFDKIYEILNYQYNAFIKEFNKQPDFIDGHQHIHQFPVVRDVFIKFYKDNKLVSNNCFLRTTYPLYGSKDLLKQIIIKASGSKIFARLIKKNNIPTNIGFSGLYKLKSESYENIRSCYKYFFSEVKHNSLIMCHPGLQADRSEGEGEGLDEIATRRVLEYKYFISKDFDDDLKCAGLIIN